MVYRDFQGMKLSALGLGCMRLPVSQGNNAWIHEDDTAAMVAYAMEHGVNYYDTAWGYHDGNSEIVMGKILANYPRDSFYLANKFPGYDRSNMDKVEQIFEEQLRKCQVDYFDFYLFHNVCESNIKGYLDPQYGIFDYLLKQKENGRIHHLGFSTHGTLPTVKRFLEAYGEHMEFCQIQLNWLDWDFQQGKELVRLLNERNIPIIVMEPLRGGKLAHLSEEHEARLRSIRDIESVPGWAFRFLQSVPGVMVTLSGMSNFQQLQENIHTYECDAPLHDWEKEALFEIAREMTSKKTLPCTACRYCTTHCPKGLDIPELLSMYNEYLFSGRSVLPAMRMSGQPKDKRPKDCIGCRSCEAVCPQNIGIADALADFARELQGA